MNINNLKYALSPYPNYCEGYGNIGASGNCYILGLTLGVGITTVDCTHEGSTLLDEINAFDLAEIDGPYIGQLNMSTVSSFCGPQGLIWGYDIAKTNELYTNVVSDKPIEYKGNLINAYDAGALVDSTKKLFGTINNKRFVIRPGAHVPFAGKHKIITNKGVIYAGVGLGIPKDRETNACILMEDIGVKKNELFETDEKTILENLAKSIIKIGINQGISYKECFVAIKTCVISENQVGCALVAAPYFTIAQNAIPKDNIGNPDYPKMATITLDEWEKSIFG